MIIGITGTLGAGKGTVVEYLKAQGFAHYSVSSMLRGILESQGKTANRDSYSVLGDALRTLHPAGPIALLHALADDAAANIIIESVHDVPEATFLKERGAVLIAVDAPLAVRYERISARGSEKDNVTSAEFERLANHEEQGGGKHNIRAVVDMADCTITNDGTLDALQTHIDQFLTQYHD